MAQWGKNSEQKQRARGNKAEQYQIDCKIQLNLKLQFYYKKFDIADK